MADAQKTTGHADSAMARLTVSVTAEQMAWLRQEHVRTGAPVAEILRRAIDAYRREER